MVALKLSIWQELVPHRGKAAMRRTIRSRNPLEREAKEPVRLAAAPARTVCQWVLVQVMRPYRRIYASLYVIRQQLSELILVMIDLLQVV